MSEDTDYLAEILAERIEDATRSIGLAKRLLDDLRSPAICDVELAEGHDGDDLAHALTVAGRELRHAQRITARRLDLIREEVATDG